MAESGPVNDVTDFNLFHRFRSKIPKNSKWRQTKMNLLDCRNNILFLWCPSERVLLTASLKTASEFGGYPEYQTLRPSNVPFENVQEVKVNPVGRQVALISPYGVNIMDMPFPVVKKDIYLNDLIVKTNSLVPPGQYVRNCPDPVVVKAHWYPGPTLDSFIAVLYSDNAIRVYNTNSLKQVHYIPIGRPNRPGLHTRGENVVDFDFALNTNKIVGNYINKYSIPLFRNSVLGQQFKGKIYVLLRNGDVYSAIVDVTISSEAKNPMIQGPLTMTPQQEDNYGSEFCSLIVLKCFPPVLVIATVTGAVHHMVVMPFTVCTSNESTSSFPSVSLPMTIRDSDELRVFESLQILVSLPVILEADSIWSSPMQLVKDPNNNMRYFCSHDAGIHLVRMPIIPQLESYLLGSEELAANFLSTLDRKSTTVEWIVCTQVYPTEPQCSNTEPAVTKGLTMMTSPDTLFSLFDDGKLITHMIPPLMISEEIITISDSSDSDKRPEQFKTFISNIIRRAQTKNQPILKLSSEPSLLHVHDLVTSAITLFRNDVFHTHKTVIEELERRVRVLSHMKESQREQMKVLYKDRIDLKNTAERLAEKYEEINDKQFDYLKRTEILLLKVQSLHASTTAERRMVANLKEKQAFLARIIKAVEQIRNRHSYFKEQETQLEVQDQRMAVFLNNNQSSSIRRNLSHLKLGIVDLMDRVNSAKQQIESDGL